MNSNRLLNNILDRQLKVMRRNAWRLSDRYDAESVHDLRVAALRADFALKFFLIRRGDVKATRGKLKKIRAVLGDARNLDIVLSHAQENLKKLHSPPSQIRGIVSLIKSRRQRSRQALIKTLRSRTFADVLRSLERLKLCHRVPGLGDLIRKSFRKTIAGLMDYRQENLKSDDLHKVRIAFKKMRYACEFLESLDKTRMQKALKFIERFQDLLGDRQDSIAAVEILSGLSHEGANKLIRMEKTNIKNCQKKFKKLWGGLFSESVIIKKLYHWAP